MVDLASLIETWVKRLNDDKGLPLETVATLIALMDAEAIEASLKVYQRETRALTLPAAPAEIDEKHKKYGCCVSLLSLRCLFFFSVIDSSLLSSPLLLPPLQSNGAC